MCIQERLFREGKLQKRTNHCDTKVNNMMFDADTDKVLCVIDLDTVMPGFVLSDIGDFTVQEQIQVRKMMKTWTT